MNSIDLIDFKLPKKDYYENESEYDYKKGGYCPIEINKKLNEYTIVDKLGWGSYSTVWKVIKNDKHYALKIQKSNKDDTELAETEINTLSKFVGKSNIVQLHNKFKYKSTNGKHTCIVMDLLGHDLHELKHQYKHKDSYNTNSESNESSESDEEGALQCIPIPIVVHIIKQILNGLNIIHSNNYIHTDIKLENILLDRPIVDIKNINDINVKIADFGTAIKTSDKSDYNIGTLHYCAPELMLGLSYSTGIDIWAVGCLIFELISGECLFDYNRYYDEASDFSDGETNSEFDSDDDDEDDKSQLEFLLLSMMSQILGKLPYKLYKRSKYYSIFFDSRGRFRYYPKFITEGTLETILKEDCEFDDETVTKLNNLLLKILVYDQDKRLNCLEIINELNLL